MPKDRNNASNPTLGLNQSLCNQVYCTLLTWKTPKVFNVNSKYAARLLGAPLHNATQDKREISLSARLCACNIRIMVVQLARGKEHVLVGGKLRLIYLSTYTHMHTHTYAYTYV
ncbi:uncharacterized protein SETTUDRAFT_39090 [Exserohilum turcica Et28A]|uniref:Uncharacterized protein n=1 Tax=Exserohilum turcicum (strain 28A) TaxID=671987 RepID=R0K4G0_EXST2|nr:uncharacterized protein SETTUDRAFT_39089 [Exserohilum turcica Et28A]XP_008024379.1 uncharacterized protein SETTUDRAFT_39090 [Exserohilum turcica Et28A]EOA87967.1 hypothetical protein SETTUDRAFT_39089 [Exserohilum turcica Et28A]EOA87968.1 hypothetical protein SETTUDRAFT_39090 [Exserohilum turcica Et28A]